jgi:hypothetical protein
LKLIELVKYGEIQMKEDPITVKKTDLDNG